MHLTRDIGASLRAGHPWVFSDVVRMPRGMQAGDVATLHAPDGRFLARGLVDPESDLAFRVFTLRRDEGVDGDLLTRRLEAALDLRTSIVSPDISGLRLVHGENDHLPGFQVDRYGSVLSIRSDGRMGLAWEDRVIDRLCALLPSSSAVVARNPHATEGRARLVRGALDGPVTIVEEGRRFLVDVMTGQKTGFFLDQRDNRSRVARLAPDRRVLNLFAYTGGFSVAAALAGARQVHTVDISPAAVELARENFRLNGVNPADHAFTTADAFDVLEEAASRPGEWDVIVVDPPSFASSRRTRTRALGAYRRLNRLAMQALAPGGWLATATCSSHVSESDFLTVLGEAAGEAGRQMTLAGVHGAGADHPVRLGFPEGRYLTFVLGRLH
ncbi:MAG: class I SAM-dependent rRNA methyltransferase [Deltaproteobacteria bacterium]|nr:MAG: class I SAM-dependent rRNA methyltransferase [Deltaproteobacteria bacterium]